MPRPVREDPLHRTAKGYSVAGCNFAEVGLVLKHLVCETDLEISDVERHARTTPVGTVASEVPPDVLPLPLPASSAAEHRILSLIKSGIPLKEISKSKSIVATCRHSWLFLLVATVNYLHLGQQAPSEALPPVSTQPTTEGQQSAMAYLKEQASVFVDHVLGVMRSSTGRPCWTRASATMWASCW